MRCEEESTDHLFFSCNIVKLFWAELSSMLNLNDFSCYEDVAEKWLSNAKHVVTNMISSALMWTFCKFRNNLHFGRVSWSGLQVIWYRLLRLLRRWRILCPQKNLQLLDNCLLLMETKVREAP
ncbi:hypothetical protein BRADI_1g32642v3 [Brachypodium distachyon]|uniref:Reverse transcriptase zinc-binding domain-containing protein n=1 Tax=Brachypodium distachyon TaxID=15368 RepID=A0A0Q3L1J6_BRADI|nr:hypothetical protein BRADI_1g32642v3 [Brachypodium distachyon]